MFYKVLKQMIQGVRAAITKKPHFMANKMPFFGLKLCFWGLNSQMKGPIPYFEDAGLNKACFAGFRSK